MLKKMNRLKDLFAMSDNGRELLDGIEDEMGVGYFR